MEEFNASLVREKIVFSDDQAMDDMDGDATPTIIRSNRVFLRLETKGFVEKVVVRAQNMHTTLRLASKVMYSYYKNGLFEGRSAPFDWEEAWNNIHTGYEKDYNPNNWGAIYINGRPAFKTTSSPFVDVVEKCALLTVDNYDATMEVTESALRQIGKTMKINHASNVATVFHDQDGDMRCGIIHRAEGRDTTFNFTAHGGQLHNRVPQSINIAAALLEAINLRFITKSLQYQLRAGEIANASPEGRKLRNALGRLVALNKGISSFETTYDVKYRPEKPELFDTV